MDSGLNNDSWSDSKQYPDTSVRCLVALNVVLYRYFLNRPLFLFLPSERSFGYVAGI